MSHVIRLVRERRALLLQLALLCVLGLASPAYAGLKEGLLAFRAKDYRGAFPDIDAAAKAGNPLALRYRAFYELYRLGGPFRNHHEGRRLLDEAVAGGDTPALAHLMEYHLNLRQRGGYPPYPPDCPMARLAATALEQRPWPRGYYLVGVQYLTGRCFPRDFNKAKALLLKGAAEHDFLAYWALAAMAATPLDGVAADPHEARKWTLLAAEEGYAEAMLYMAELYRGMVGHAVDHVAAVAWLRLALAQPPSSGADVEELGLNPELTKLAQALLAKEQPERMNNEQVEQVRQRMAAFKLNTAWADYEEAEFREELAAASRWDALRGTGK